MGEPEGERPHFLQEAEQHLLSNLVGRGGFFGNVVFGAELAESGVDLEEVEFVRVNLIDQLLDTVHKGLGGAVDRVVEDLVRGAVFVDDALVHEEDAGADIAGKTHLVGNYEHCHALLCQLADYAQHLPHHCGVQGRSRFIEKDHLRVHGKRAGNCHPLFLAAGKGRRIDIGLLGHAHLLQKFHGLTLCFLTGKMKERHWGIDNILKDGHVLKEVETLEHHAHFHAEFVKGILSSRDILAVYYYLPGSGRLKHVDGP